MALAAYIAHVLARVRATPVDLSLLQPKAIPGTIFSGATGVALFLAEVVRIQGRDDALLDLSREWLDAADGWARHAKPTDWNDLARGFVYGEAGIGYVDVLLSAGSGDPSRAHAAVERIERAARRFDDVNQDVRPSGVVGGEAGIAHAARDLSARLPDGPDYEPTRALLQRIQDRAVASLLAVHSSPFDTGPHALLGMAHGLAGELFVLSTFVGADHPAVRARLAELAELRQTDPNGHVYWLGRRVTDDTSLLGSWCNGTAGHTLLWTEIARRTGSEEASKLAAASAGSTAFLMSANVGLCCGLAGQSIALQRFADFSGDARYTRRAYARLERATVLAQQVPSYAFGFWQGALGVAFAALARLGGERSFPCLESPARRRAAPSA